MVQTQINVTPSLTIVNTDTPVDNHGGSYIASYSTLHISSSIVLSYCIDYSSSVNIAVVIMSLIVAVVANSWMISI